MLDQELHSLCQVLDQAFLCAELVRESRAGLRASRQRLKPELLGSKVPFQGHRC